MVTNNPMRHLHNVGRKSGPAGRIDLAGRAVMMAMALLTATCAPPNPKAVLRVSDVETYWVLDPTRTEKKFLAPAVRFRVENISTDTLIAVDSVAAFLREGSPDTWGSGFFRLTEGRKRLAPGAKVLVTISSDARYTTEGAPEAAFANPTFKTASVKYFLRVGSSQYVEFGRLPIENVIGSKDARLLLSRPSQEFTPKDPTTR